MTSDLIYYLFAIFIVFFITNLICNKIYKINFIKLLIFTILSIIVGVLMTMILYWIENGEFGGISFYGGIFLMPFFSILFGVLSKINMFKLQNLSAFLLMITSAIMKYKCFKYDCCKGRKIPIVTEYGYLTFPSQLAEMFFAIFVFIILCFLFKKNKDRKDLYPMMMVIYGIGRLNLNTFRLYEPVLSFMSWGHIWSIVSIIIGFVWLFIIYKKKRTVLK